MSSEFKKKIVEAFRENLQTRIEHMKAGLELATDGAQGDEVKSEGKYDTRAIEASYLAKGQSELLIELESALEAVERIDWYVDFERVKIGACVEADQNGEERNFLLVSHGGGEVLDVEGLEIQVVSKSAPLGESLDDKKVGDELEEALLILNVF